MNNTAAESIAPFFNLKTTRKNGDDNGSAGRRRRRAQYGSFPSPPLVIPGSGSTGLYISFGSMSRPQPSGGGRLAKPHLAPAIDSATRHHWAAKPETRILPGKHAHTTPKTYRPG